MTNTSKYGIEISWAIATEISKAMASQGVSIRELADVIGKGIRATSARLVGWKPFTAIEFALAAKHLGFEPHVLIEAAEQRVAPEAKEWAPKVGFASTERHPPIFCARHPFGTSEDCAACSSARARWSAWVTGQVGRAAQVIHVGEPASVQLGIRAEYETGIRAVVEDLTSVQSWCETQRDEYEARVQAIKRMRHFLTGDAS